MARGNRVDSAAGVENNRNAVAAGFNAKNFCMFAEIELFRLEPTADYGRRLPVVTRQNLSLLDDGHVGSETTEGLGQFNANRTAADDRQMLRQLAQIEDRFVG